MAGRVTSGTAAGHRALEPALSPVTLLDAVFSRSAPYLKVLSAAVVALALVAQATDFKGPFVALTIVLLSVVCYIGATTVIRVGQPAVEELTWIAEMNRSRAA